MAPQDLRKVKEDKTIERPARKISMTDGGETPAAEPAPVEEAPAPAEESSPESSEKQE